MEAARFVVICYVASYKRVGEDTPEGLFRSIKLGTCGLCHFQGSVRTRLAQKICLGHKLVASGKALLFDPSFPNHRTGTIIPCHGGWYALSPGPGPWGCSGNVDRMDLHPHSFGEKMAQPCPCWALPVSLSPVASLPTAWHLPLQPLPCSRPWTPPVLDQGVRRAQGSWIRSAWPLGLCSGHLASARSLRLLKSGTLRVGPTP